jgi:tRNA threonylcarbamoyladenosine biosynthesis protein TsaE
MYEMELKTLEDTKKIAVRLAKKIKPGDVVCLVGDLGAGKTTFTQMLCEALGTDEYVTSPSFSIMNAYTGVLGGKPIPIYHFDVYRISDADEMDEIGFDDYLFGKGISIVEWATKVEGHIPKNAIWIELKLTVWGTRMISSSGLEMGDEIK